VLIVVLEVKVVVLAFCGACKLTHGSHGMQSVWKATLQESDGPHAATHSVASAVTASGEQMVPRLAGGGGMVVQCKTGMHGPHCALHGVHSSVSCPTQGRHIEQFSLHVLALAELQLTTVCS